MSGSEPGSHHGSFSRAISKQLTADRSWAAPDELTPEPYQPPAGGSNSSQRLTADEDQERAAWFRLPFELRLAVVRRGLARWHAMLADRCPGEHEYVAHRDSRPPWCDACGFTDSGLHRSEYGSGHAGQRIDED